MTKTRQNCLFALTLCFAASCGAPEVTSPVVESPSTQSGNAQENAAQTTQTPKQDETSEPALAPQATEPAKEPAPAQKTPKSEDESKAAKSEIPDANINVGELNADGLLTKDIACKSESTSPMALLGIVLVTAWMAPKKAELYACTQEGTETRVRWRAKNGNVQEIHASGDPKARACIEKALTSGKPVLDGHCAATIVHGPK